MSRNKKYTATSTVKDETKELIIMTTEQYEREMKAKDAEIARLTGENERLRTRLKIADGVLNNAPRQSEAYTIDQWKIIAHSYEFNWKCCSEEFNRVAGELRTDIAACRKELDEAQSLAARRGKGMEALKKLCDEKDAEIKALKEAK